ncbi:MAG: hypothetical protein ACKERG_02835 [Candidatus Hodgkinia cicadicola]
MPLVDYSAYVKAGIGRFLLERRKVVTDVVRGRWLKWPLLPLLGDDRLVRKVLWTARLSLASIRSCAPVKIKKLNDATAVASFVLRGLDFKTVQVRELKSDPLKLSRASGLLVALAAATGVSLRSLAFDSCWAHPFSQLFRYWA